MTPAHRKLTFDDKKFIYNSSLSNLGPSKTFRLRSCLKGGFDKVTGTVVDYKNFKRDMNKFIGNRDAQMIVDKMKKRKEHLPNFSFYVECDKRELICMFWADETSKCNYKEFGDVVSFDATFRTNK